MAGQPFDAVSDSAVFMLLSGFATRGRKHLGNRLSLCFLLPTDWKRKGELERAKKEAESF